MRNISFVTLLALMLLCSQLFSQKSDKNSLQLERDKSPVMNGQKVAASDENQDADYKLIRSTSSYIELEFYPRYNKPSVVEFEGQQFIVINFDNAMPGPADRSGQPDLRSRVFPVLLPSDVNNRVSVIDYDVHDAPNVNLAPIPQMRQLKYYGNDMDNLQFLYLREQKAYTQNKFLPESVASLVSTGPLRDLTISDLVIYPYQFNPVTKQVKQYTRIRIRIDFGQAPQFISKPRSKQEIDLLSGVALNSDIALGWTRPLNGKVKKDVLVTDSPFATGDWYKIEIRDNGSGGSEGMYKITKSFLESAGINLSNVDPRTIKMYGNGGYMLPDTLNGNIPNDIQELPVYIEGEADGHFDANDYILFYGRSINNWTYDTTGNVYNHYVDPYSLSNFVWIRLNTPGNGIRMAVVQSENNPNPYVPTSFRDKLFFEPEISNLINEGNLWLSERKSNGESFNFNTTLTGLEANSDVYYKVKPACRVMNTNWPAGCPFDVRFLIKDDKTTISERNFQMHCVDPGFGPWIYTAWDTFSVNSSLRTPANSEAASLRASFVCSTPDGEGYLDYMEIQYSRRLNSASSDFLRFDSPNIDGPVEYNVSSFSSSDIKVFDVTQFNNVKRIQPLVVSASNVKFQKTQTRGSLSGFCVAGPTGYKTPSAISQRVPNQNLHGIADGADFIIITHPDFISAANRLKQKREAPGPGDPNYLKTMIVTCDQIYDEFSGGVLDAVAIRDFLKFAYDNWQRRPSYVLLLGSGSFDYKSILTTSPQNWVPAYEVSDPQIDQVAGYTTDDFFVNIVPDAYGRPDVGIGRITARSLADANNYLDKVDCYESPSNNGYWKNKMVFVADDGYTTDGYDGTQHTDQCEQLAENFTPNVIDRLKLYLIAYPTVITAQGRRKPGVNADIVKTWNAGCLNIHYTGHGSPEVWAHEYVLEKDVVISQLHNNCIYPFVTIASCDMAKFDNPLSQSATELFVLSANKGAIGTLAASRPVYGGANATLMQNFFNKLYLQRDTLLYPMRYGKAIFQTKQVLPSYSVNDMKFIMFCDPSLRTALPRFETRIDSISGLSNDTMQALSRIKIYGSILNPDSTVWTSYSGQTYIKVYDVTRQIEIDETYNNLVYAYRFKLPGGIIYSGFTPVANGKWTTEFIVPKDLSYLNQHGKIVNYFYNNQADGSGLYTNFFVGGINQNAPSDTTGPKISAYLNDRKFRTGDVVNENFRLIADLFDESGINTTGTIGHKLEATVDGDESHKIDLTNYYNSDTTYKSGSLSYDFTGIADGKHTLKVKAWDTYNNSNESTIEFTVIPSGGLQVVNVYNYPNPFRDGTAFTFQHNYPGLITAKIKIYTVAGRLIKEIDEPSTNDKFVFIPWNGKDADGETLGNGIYIYKLVVSTDDGSSMTSTGKLAVLK